MTFQTRTFNLVNGQVQQAMLAYAVHLPFDQDIEVVFKKRVKVRSLDANGLYWKRLTEIADQAWFNGKQYCKEVWHVYAAQNLMTDEVVTKDGETVSKWVECPTGEPVVISTTKLERKCFADYITAVEAFGAGLGVQFSANPRDRA